MIIDADVHISPTPEGGNSITISELLRIMDRSGIDKALTWLQPPYFRDTDLGNQYVYEATQSHPDRIIGFGWVDPHHGIQKAEETIKRCLNDYGFYGIKMNGAQNSFYIDDPKLSLPVIEKIAGTGKPLALHVGTDAYEATHPFRVAKIAEQFPELPILMVHMGGVGFADLTNAAIEVAEKYPNITLVGSAVRSIPVLKAIEHVGYERICFGSDTPFELMHVEFARYRALLQDHEDHIRQAIFCGNISRFLGL